MSELDRQGLSAPATNGHAPAQDVEMGDSASAIDVKQEVWPLLLLTFLQKLTSLLKLQATAYPSDPIFSPTDANASAHASNSAAFTTLDNAQVQTSLTASHSHSAMARNAGTTPSGTRQSTPGAATGSSTSLNALPPSAIIPPANPHGSPTRVYINSKVTPTLLEGLKWVAANEPEKPLKWLGEFLLRKSAETEGT